MLPRLLSKHEIDKRKAEEERQQIESGMRIAEKVDTLRETLASEEVAFSTYRIDSLTSIQKEIDARFLVRDELDRDIKKKRKEWSDLLEPLDKNWKKYVEDEKNRIDSQVKSNDELSSKLHKELFQATSRKKESDEFAKKLQSERFQYERLTASAKKKEEEANQVLDKARNKAQVIVSKAEIKDAEVISRLDSVKEYETHLQLQAKSLKDRELKIEQREFKVLAKELQYYSPVKKV